MLKPFLPIRAFPPFFLQDLLPFRDFLRPNAHWHALVLEGGFSPDGRFLFLPIHDTQKLTEIFRRAVISGGFASALLCRRHTGISVDNRVRIGAEDHTARFALAQYKWSERAQPAPAI